MSAHNYLFNYICTQSYNLEDLSESDPQPTNDTLYLDSTYNVVFFACGNCRNISRKDTI